MPELTIVVPTLNERENVPRLVERLDRVLRGIAWEAVFVDDDSDDGTLEALHDLARRDPRVRYIHRIGRAGLSSACLEGMASSSAPFLAVMDADLQHDERLLPDMLEALRGDEADLVVGSRYVEGGGMAGWSGPRKMLSRIATLLAKPVLRVRLEDPMSGFFMLTRALYRRSMRRVSGQGFKLLLDIMASAAGAVRVKELPFEFRTRVSGVSKLDSLVMYEYFLLLADKLVGRYIPIRFVIFCTVGCFGAVLHLSVLGSLLYFAGRDFVLAQTIATIMAMTVNFTLNNIFTYRARQLKGWD
ncbi:MAG: glycosyltransferase family 2 protein, partial [Alphaproteobacteria bacterium]